ncbi:hypothetical protein TKK_0012066 [Trichogramma kaykai]
MTPTLMTKESFREKTAAVHIVLLINYLNKNKITQENLDNEAILNDIIRKGIGKSVRKRLPTKNINAFKETLRFYNIDELKKTNLYRINRGILAVACIEHVLYPEKDHREHRKIYNCNDAMATVVYKNLRKLCGFTTEDELDPITVISTRSFFRSTMLYNNKTFLEILRDYLKTVDINVEEKHYIMNASIQFINNKKTFRTIHPVPLPRYIMNQKYFQKKGNAEVLINLVNYLEKNEVKEEDLENEKILIDILRKGLKKFVTYTPSKLELEEFKKTILNYTIDYLTVANLYRINRGILTVVCVEYVLSPGQDYEEYKKIYGVHYSKASALYKELSGIPKENKVNEAVGKSARSFFKCQERNLDTIRLYLQNIDIDSEEIEYIKNASIQLIKSNIALYTDKPRTNTISPIEGHPINVIIDDEETLPPMPDMPLVQDMTLVVDQGLIISNKDEQSTNMMKTIEYHTINVPIDDEQPHPNMIQIIYPDMPSLNVDLPSMVSIPVDQGLIISNKDEQSTNMMKTIEYHPINVTTDDEDMLPPMPDMPWVQVDPSSVVPIPVDQGFLSRYSLNEVVLAKRFNSYFWPAKIIEVYSDKMYVTFFPLSEEMEKEEVSSKEDVKAFTDEEIEAAGVSLCTGLSQEAFEFAKKFALEELSRIHSR